MLIAVTVVVVQGSIRSMLIDAGGLDTPAARSVATKTKLRLPDRPSVLGESWS